MKYFWIIIISLLPTLALFAPGLPITHDGPDHVARIANFYQSLSEGNIVPRWAGNLNWGYGHPILMFLYPLPSYVASFFHALGFTLVDSTKLVFGLSYIVSILLFFIWSKAQWGSKAGFVGAMLYGFAPYRFVDLHVRGAIGEHVAFVFLPLIMYFLLKQKWIAVAFSWGALILSHNAVAFMFLPVFALYALYLLVFEAKNKQSFIAHCVLSIIFSFGFSAFFWIPAFFEGKYTLRDIVIKGEFTSRFVPWKDFFYSSWNFGGTDTLSKQLGLAHWAVVLLSVVVAIKNKKSRTFLIPTILLLGASLVLMTSVSSVVWQNITLIQKFQFPWRLLTMTTFVSAVLGSAVYSIIPRRWQWVLVALSLLAVIWSVPMWKSKGYVHKPEVYYTQIYNSTTDTGESSPIWSTRFMEYTAVRPLEVVDGEATVTQGTRTSTMHEYILEVKKSTLMMENTVYFPGWNIHVDGVPADIQFQNPDYRGRMLFRVTPENKNVRVVFENTKVRTFANMISLSSVVLLFNLFLWQKRK